MKTYTPAFFIKRFSAIPDSKWTDCGEYKDPKDSSKRCAYGHLRGPRQGVTVLSQAMYDLFPKCTYGPFKDVQSQLININDKPSKAYPQKTPKARVLAALRSLPKDAKVRV